MAPISEGGQSISHTLSSFHNFWYFFSIATEESRFLVYLGGQYCQSEGRVPLSVA